MSWREAGLGFGTDNLRATHGQSWRVQGQGVWQPRGGKMAGRHNPCGPHLRLSLFVHPVDLASNKHSDLAFAPSLLAVQEVGDEEGETWQGRSPGAKRKGLRTESSVCFHPTLPQQTLSSLNLSSSPRGEACQTKPMHWPWCLVGCGLFG